MKLFTQPCLIKKNTTKIRKHLEDLGYTRAKLLSDEPEYNNDKEPWIVAVYDIYVCLDKDYYPIMVEKIESNEVFKNITELLTRFLGIVPKHPFLVKFWHNLYILCKGQKKYH